jgi:Icc-related predicted phosphoesterase
MSVEEHEQFAQDPSLIEPLFARLLTERVEEWVKMADERLAGQNVRCLISAGNDDLFEVDEVLKSSKTIEALDGEIVDLDGFEMLGLGYSNMTPWDCPRDITEEQLAAKIDALAGGIQRMDQAVFCIHVPPYDSGLDAAPELTQDMSMVLDPIGQPNMVPVGSTAVREAILKYQPMLGLHGHIHESRGVRQLGRTTLVNPGSEYAEGILHGAVFELESGKGLGQVNLVEG